MCKSMTTIFLLCLVVLGLALSGCGSSGSGSATSPATTNATVSGIASLNSAGGTVSLKDSSAIAQEKTTTINSNGSYSIDVTGLKAPFMLKATWTDASGTNQMYSISATGGKANINPLSDAAMNAAANGDSSTLFGMRSGDDGYRGTSVSFESIINQLRTVLAPLFALYNVSGNGVDDDPETDDSGLSSMLQAVSITVKSGVVTVTNKQTGGIIFTGSLNNLNAGTFNQQNMPSGTGSTACTYTYSAWGACDSTGNQTRTVMSSSPAGCTGTPVLSQACVSTPTTCTSFMYSAWGACQSNNTQTRTVLTSSPAGCTGGSPVLSQACTNVPPAPTLTLAQVKASCTSCHGLTVNTTVLASGGYTVTGRTASSWLSTVNTMVGFGASLAPGFTAQDYANFLATVP